MIVKLKTDKKIEITEKDFRDYERLRSSGVTNMLMIKTVSELSGLSKEKIKAIISNYDQIKKEV